jgi:hypothetical protein
MNKSILVGGSIACLFLICCLNFQPITANENPRYYYNVKIILISRVYNSIKVEGYHNSNEGLGYDENIKLYDSNWIRLFGLLIIYNESDVLEQSNIGGWLHTKIEILNYSGWMKNQFDNKHLIMIGDCDTVILTTYRG